VAAAVILVSVLCVVLIGMRPGYDAFGWLVWGRQVLHGNLNTDGAPSWKPMTFLFTLPYALAGKSQMSLWTVTAVAGALGGAVFAGRIASKLTGPCPGRRFAPFAAAVFAGVGMLGIGGYVHQVLIADSDPLVATICLAAIDSHLSKRPRLAFALIVLASLGRPEVWPYAVLYAVWLWRAVASARRLAVIGVALIPALWFSVPALTSKDWFVSGDLALSSINAANVIHGNQIIGVISRFGSLYELPMQLAALGAVVIALARRDRQLLTLIAAACLWVAIEIAFVLHGWSGAPRYLFEPAAVMIVLAGVAVGRALAYAPQRRRGLRWLGPVMVAGLVVALAPTATSRVRADHREVSAAHVAGREIDRLQDVIARIGGAARVRACGQPVTLVGAQSAVAWAVGLNVGNVGFRPGRSIRRGQPIVIFKPHLRGWQVRPVHLSPEQITDCRTLKTDSDFG
jgi:hypothetical protein